MKASVFVPAYESRAIIPLVIERLVNQTIPLGEYEIFILNNNDLCPDDKSVIDELNKKEHVHMIEGEAYPKLYEDAASEAKGELFLYLASHCVPKKDWVEKWLSIGGPACGSIINPESDNYIRNLESDVNIKTRDIIRKNLLGSFMDYHNASIPREMYKNHGGMNKHMKYVMCVSELGARMHNAGNEIKFTKENPVLHYNQTTLRGFCQGIFEEGYDKGKLHLYDKELGLKYFHQHRFAKYLDLIKKVRLPLYMGITLYYYILHGIYGIAHVLRLNGLKRRAALKATVQSHRRGQLQGLKGK